MGENTNKQYSRSPNFSLAFQQMASFAAIAKTRNTRETLDELIQQCFVILPNDPLSSPQEIASAIHTLFGHNLSIKEVTISVERLTNKKQLVQLPGGLLGLEPSTRQIREARIAEAKKLEEEVKSVWLMQVTTRYPYLKPEETWTVLKKYLGQAFRRHGIQTIALLDSTAIVNHEHNDSLSRTLNEIISQEFEKSVRDLARNAISSFISTVHSDRRRAEYIAQLADAAFNYFSLTVAPEVSENLRRRLNDLTLFLDTNFLFGILNLHVNPQVDVSDELLGAVQKFNLPFKLRYHETTSREMSNTLFHFGKELKKQKWPQQISRAAVESEALSGIEMRYHERNAEERIDVEDFLAPYNHWEILLKDRGINVYRVDSSEHRLKTRADLEADYKEFLLKLDREKPHEAIQHDMAVLETVRSLRSNAKSTLDAGAIFVTCDYYLCRFDWETNHINGQQRCTILPSFLWQILRPFISDSQQFDQAFAETFALPEFTLIRGGAQRAASKMLSILAGYRDIPEETAFKMLANDLLITELQSKKTEDEFILAIETALAKENAGLINEKATLTKQLIIERDEREARERELAAATLALQKKERVLAEQKKSLGEKELAIKTFENKNQESNQRIKETIEQVLKEKREKEEAEAHSQQLEQKKKDAEQQILRTTKVASLAIATLVVLLLEVTVNYILPWSWLITHPNSYGLQGCISLMVFLGILGFGVKSWRKFSWFVGILSLLSVALEILGGPTKTP